MMKDILWILVSYICDRSTIPGKFNHRILIKPPMLSLSALSDFLEDQKKIIFDLNISVKNMLRLEEDLVDHEAAIKRHGFFQHHWGQLRFISIVQLAKLYSNRVKNDERCFIKLFNIINDSPYDDSIKQMLEQNALSYNTALESHPEHPLDEEPEIDFSISFSRWISTKHEVEKFKRLVKSRDELMLITQNAKAKMIEPEIVDVIRKVLDARDKIYAHKEPKAEVQFTTSVELKKLVDLTNEIYNCFYIGLYDSEVAFAEAHGWEIDFILKSMSRLKEMDIEDMKRRKKPPLSSD